MSWSLAVVHRTVTVFCRRATPLDSTTTTLCLAVWAIGPFLLIRYCRFQVGANPDKTSHNINPRSIPATLFRFHRRLIYDSHEILLKVLVGSLYYHPPDPGAPLAAGHLRFCLTPRKRSCVFQPGQRSSNAKRFYPGVYLSC
ncbi:hypothetical protein PILCRDRAFT_480979 [Piloderma croceum F 1598]|uniref:Uncharacterized protein n=1 Tax=Piloderma croceum (strain F 1598) TaxID=765440 RepID=A0A0C3FQJ0_PILCF|nr:hypothetical protein PILCRDRAFT_751088 [Piloderma croceum F 1598]KIM81984.1 hypothetical protein PILCRDRAFT_480979 [Piloderma croceum F 1598]